MHTYAHLSHSCMQVCVGAAFEKLVSAYNQREMAMGNFALVVFSCALKPSEQNLSHEPKPCLGVL